MNTVINSKFDLTSNFLKIHNLNLHCYTGCKDYKAKIVVPSVFSTNNINIKFVIWYILWCLDNPYNLLVRKYNVIFA